MIDIFRKKQTWKQQSFTNIVSTGEKIVVFCSENSYHTAVVLSYVLSWKKHFKQISIILPNYDYAFFSKINMGESTTFFNLANDLKPFGNSVIFNFTSSKKVRKILTRCHNSTIIGIEDPSNLQFFPAPTEPVFLLKKFANFFDFPWQINQLSIDVTRSELVVAKHQFIKNNFKNFILDFNNDISAKVISKIVQLVKHDFAANIYFTGKRVPDKDFINIEDIKISNLLELFDLAEVSDLLITNKLEVAGAFADLDVTQIYFGDNTEVKQLKYFEIADLQNLKNKIDNILNR